jgi:hypothetical protein
MFEAIFARRSDGEDKIVGNMTYRLNADTIAEAEEEAWALPRPEGANLIKLARVGGLVERNILFAL